MRRTKVQLRDALVALMLERGWDAVSVQDVCARADVGRSTFYTHFADKENLLLSGFDDLHSALAHEAQQAKVPFAFVEPLLVHAANNLALLRAVSGRQSGQQVQWRFRDVVATMVAFDLAALDVPTEARIQTTAFIAGGFMEMLTGWLDMPSVATPRELAGQFRGLALAVVAAARTCRER